MISFFVPKETAPDESRVAATPDTVRKMVRLGFAVTVEKGAGGRSGFSDQAFVDAGAQLSERAAETLQRADVVLKLQPFLASEVQTLKSGALTISLLWPFQNPDTVRALCQKGISAFAMDLIPRISRAQSMDALSSQSNLAGYKAVILAADHLKRIFPLMTTAAGTIKPARVVVMGAGVAGLQAIATAKRLGAVVEVSDVRPAVKEQVESLGGRFIQLPGMETMEAAGGYAKEASAGFLQKQQALVHRHLVAADVIITTALIPGKPAPKLVSVEVVREMRQGSVIVDLAVEQGGNCELSEPGKIVVKEGVTIIGLFNVAGLISADASQMYARNLLAVVEHLCPKGKLEIDFSDEINAASLVTHGGKIMRPDIADLVGA